MSEDLMTSLFMSVPVSANSPKVVSDQSGVHDNLPARLARYRGQPSRRPIPAHSSEAFAQMVQWLDGQGVDPTGAEIVFDSGCGRGDSSLLLAQQQPQKIVIGVDKSSARLERLQQELAGQTLPSNLLLVRADLRDIYRLMAANMWRLSDHKIYYPNPWPKAVHLGRRWHASDVWPDIMALGGAIELRTNWRIYAAEFASALKHYDIEADMHALPPAPPTSLHERKYQHSEHDLWRVQAQVI